ncbi:MAG TPA: hypothetical protein VNO35_14240 [Steroidobacteraceae bacterium]|nr:hypothetical protein [Steroidobacteraceae bacterium]
MQRRLASEALGSLLLSAAVIGSGIVAERLSAGNSAVALLANTAATVGMLAVLIRLLGPVSGAERHRRRLLARLERARGP